MILGNIKGVNFLILTGVCTRKGPVVYFIEPPYLFVNVGVNKG